MKTTLGKQETQLPAAKNERAFDADVRIHLAIVCIMTL